MISFSKTIGFRLLLVSLILLALPILVEAFILIYGRYQSDVANAKAHLRESAYLRELPLSRVQPIRKGVMDTLTLFLDVKNSLSNVNDALNPVLKQLSIQANFEDIVFLSYQDEQFKLLASGDINSKNLDFSKVINAQKLFDGETVERGFAEYLLIVPSEFVPKFVVARGIFSEGGEPIGAIAIIDDASKLLQELIKPDNAEFPIEFALTLPSSIVLASSNPSLRFQHFRPLSEDQIEEFQMLFATPVEIPGQLIEVKKQEESFWQFTWENKKRIAISTHIPGTEFTLIAFALYNDIYQSLFGKINWMYASYLIIFCAGVTIVYLLTKRMMRPVQQLCSVMMSVKEGNLFARYEKDRFGMQINQLGDQFNEMMQLLLTKQKNVEKEIVEKEKNLQQLQLGHNMQLSLLEIQAEVPPQLDLACRYIPAKDVGGDFYDFVQKPSGEVVLTIADASGKGLNACCYALMLRSLLRTLSLNEPQLGGVMRKANNLFVGDTGMSGMFVTVQMVVLNPETGHIHHFSFGHNPGFIVTQNGQWRALMQKEMAMGVLKKEQYIDAYEEQMESGDVLILYSDGVSEAHNTDKKLWGLESLIQSTVKHHLKKADQIASGILSDLKEFVGSAEQHDDITLMVMKKRAS